ncbi:uncharacterized protein LOC128931496 [Callithrix jacchus]
MSLSFTGPHALTIMYSCIANGPTVLEELTRTGGSYQVPWDLRLRPRGFSPSRVVPAKPAPQDAELRGRPEPAPGTQTSAPARGPSPRKAGVPAAAARAPPRGQGWRFTCWV